MKKVIVLRHAKSGWAEMDDTHRSLTTEGILEVLTVYEKFKTYKIAIDEVITSDAIRAVSTAVIFSQKVGLPTDRIKIRSWLYETDEKMIFETLAGMDDARNTLAIVGHNPTLGNLVNSCSGAMTYDFPPGGLAVIEFAVNSWKDLRQEAAKKANVNLLIKP